MSETLEITYEPAPPTPEEIIVAQSVMNFVRRTKRWGGRHLRHREAAGEQRALAAKAVVCQPTRFNRNTPPFAGVLPDRGLKNLEYLAAPTTTRLFRKLVRGIAA